MSFSFRLWLKLNEPWQLNLFVTTKRFLSMSNNTYLLERVVVGISLEQWGRILIVCKLSVFVIVLNIYFKKMDLSLDKHKIK